MEPLNLQAKHPAPSAESAQGMFGESSYAAFMIGVFVIGGVLALPLVYGGVLGLTYAASLPWSLAVRRRSHLDSLS